MRRTDRASVPVQAADFGSTPGSTPGATPGSTPGAAPGVPVGAVAEARVGVPNRHKGGSPPNGVPTLVYDGDCGFCTASARWVARRWRVPARAVAWQRLDRSSLEAMGLTAGEAAEAAWWVDERGVARRGHLAIGESLVAVGGPWGLVGRALLVPPVRWLAAIAYPVVAAHRHRLPGATPACRSPGGDGS